MSEFSNVSVVKKANVYFNGNVSSRTITFEDGSKKTLGVMLPGDYEFNTAEKELMEITFGDLDVLQAGEDEWITYKDGDHFYVPANSSFKLKVKAVSDYICSFISE